MVTARASQRASQLYRPRATVYCTPSTMYVGTLWLLLLCKRRAEAGPRDGHMLHVWLLFAERVFQ